MTLDRKITARLAAALLWMLLSSLPVAGDEPLPLLIDSDMGLDDMRALALLLDAEGLKVHGISTVFGSQNPRAGGKAAIRLLGGLGHRPIPVSHGADKPLEAKFEPPAWRPVCEAAIKDFYGNEGHILLHEPAPEMLARLARREGSGVRLVCLGPLTNLALALEADPGLTNVVHTLVIACADTLETHFNITADPEAALRVLRAPWRRVVLVGGCGEAGAADFGDVLEGIEKEHIGGLTAGALEKLSRSAAGGGEHPPDHAVLGDDLAALFLIRPSRFTVTDPFCATVALEGVDRGMIRPSPEGPGPCHTEAAVPGVPGPKLVRTILDSIGGLLADEEPSPAGGGRHQHNHGGVGTLLRQFPPLEAGGYREDVAPMVRKITEAHGMEEWRWSVLAGEVHGHLGLYSMIGVKMGLRALEILGAPRESVELSPHCGSEPPLSCLQDGLIVSTGATPGRGLLLSSTSALLLPPLYVDEEVDDPAARGPAAAASFYHGERMITIRLLPQVQQLVADRIRALAERHGGTTGEAYFHALRAEALQLELELDRNEIFEVFE
jgi:pyrimidine-specific ribonucleoside hydrolase